MPDADFAPDESGLADAVRRLVEARGVAGSPHVDPDAAPPELPEGWTDDGIGGTAALGRLAPWALDHVSRLDDPGFIAHMDPPTPWFTWAATMWTAATNQNLLHPDTGPAARRLEPRVVQWLAPAFGMRGGHMVPGSTVANLTALWVARDLRGARRVVASEAAHVSIAKAARILGLEHVSVPVDGAQRVRPDALPDDLTDAALVLTAGTVATGAVDPLDIGRDAAWRHVDAAWAGALRFSKHAEVLSGIDAADSVSLSAHKWLYQPKDSGLVLFAEPDAAHEAVSFGGGYLAAPNVGVLGSRGAAALPLAVTLLAWGRRGLARRVEAGMADANRLADLVAAHDDLELWRRPVTGVVNWRPRSVGIHETQAALSGAWASSAVIAGETWLRSVCANPDADPQRVVDAVLAASRRA